MDREFLEGEAVLDNDEIQFVSMCIIRLDEAMVQKGSRCRQGGEKMVICNRAKLYN